MTEGFEKTRGECYYRMEEGRWDFNSTYEEIPALRLEETQNQWKSLKRGILIYVSYINNPNKLRNLVEPDPIDFIL